MYLVIFFMYYIEYSSALSKEDRNLCTICVT